MDPVSEKKERFDRGWSSLRMVALRARFTTTATNPEFYFMLFRSTANSIARFHNTAGIYILHGFTPAKTYWYIYVLLIL